LVIIIIIAIFVRIIAGCYLIIAIVAIIKDIVTFVIITVVALFRIIVNFGAVFDFIVNKKNFIVVVVVGIIINFAIAHIYLPTSYLVNFFDYKKY
jgi:hypothetical protein